MQHDKLLKLLNLANTVDQIEILIQFSDRNVLIKTIVKQLLLKLPHVTRIILTPYINKNTNIKQLYQEYMSSILFECIKNNDTMTKLKWYGVIVIH